MTGANETQVKNFCHLLEELMQKHQFAPSRIYNVDETGVQTVPTKLPKVLAIKGTKRVAQVVSAQRGITVTVVSTMNVVGHFDSSGIHISTQKHAARFS